MVSLHTLLVIISIVNSQDDCENNTAGTLCKINGKGDGSTITCRANDPCEITCSGDSSCKDDTIDGQNATDVTIICTGKDACKGNTKIYCGTGECRLSCIDSTSCEDANIINPNNRAHAFICTGTGCDSIQGDVTIYTQQPTESPITSAPTPSLDTFAPSGSPSKYPTISPTKYLTISSSEISLEHTIIPSKNPTHTVTTITNSHSTDLTQTPTTRPTFIGKTNDSGNQVATKVGLTTTNVDTYIDNVEIFGAQMWLYIGIGTAVLCLLLGFVVLIQYKKRKTKKVFSGNNWSNRPKSPLSTSCNKAQSFAIALVEENVNENVNDIKNTSPQNTSPKNSFQEVLMNKVAADNLMMNDVVQEMTTPLEATGIEMNPLEEGDETVKYVNDIDNIENNVQNEDQNVLMDINNIVTADENGNLTLGEENINNNEDGIDNINSHDVEIVYQVHNEMITEDYDEEEYDIQYDEDH